MSLMAMKKGFEKYAPVYVGILAVIMIGGVVLSGFGANVSPQNAPLASTAKPVVKVGDKEISSTELDFRVKQVLDQQAMFGPMILSPAEKAKYRYMILNGFKQEQAVVVAAKKAGVTVSDADIAKKRNEIWEQARASFAQTLGLKEGATDGDIDTALNQQSPGMSVARLKAERLPDEVVRLQLYQEGLSEALKKQLAVTDDEVKNSYSDIRVRHILIKIGDGGLPEPQAKEKAEKVLKEVLAAPDKMGALAKQYSDDPGSKDKEGIYEWAPGSQYVPEFTKGALAVEVGKVNPELVKTPYGFHIIKLEGKRQGSTFPKDWDKEKIKYIDEYKARLVNEKVGAAIAAEVPGIPVEITDPMLKAAQLLEEARVAPDGSEKTGKYEQAITELLKIKKESDPEGAAPLLMAEAYKELKKPTEMIAAYEEALTYSNTAETRLALAQVYLEQKQKEKAVKQLEEAEKLAIPNIQLQMQLAMLYDQAGDKERNKKAMAKAEAMMKRMSEQQAAQRGTVAPPVNPSTDKPSATTPTAEKSSTVDVEKALTQDAPAPSPAQPNAPQPNAPQPDAKKN
jgi:parvulin-like peptidyl-prolyl isomerase